MKTDFHSRDYLVSNRLDFWLLGGLSLLIFALLYLAKLLDLRSVPAALALVAPFIALGLEYPHLIASYRLAYRRERSFIRDHWPELVLAPIGIIALLALALVGPQLFPRFIGISQWIVGAFVHLIFFGFGWHRLRQAFGAMVMTSKLKSFELLQIDRQLIHLFFISFWVLGYLRLMSSREKFEFFGLTVMGFKVDPSVIGALSIVVFLLWLTFVWRFFYQLPRRIGRLPSWTFFVPAIALLFWWLALEVLPDFFFYLAAGFHSLQYLAFVWAFERGPSTRPNPAWQISGWLALYGGMGALWYWGLPWLMAKIWIPPVLTTAQGWVGIAYVSVSVHHYLIDQVVWKTKDPSNQRILS